MKKDLKGREYLQKGTAIFGLAMKLLCRWQENWQDSLFE